MIDFKKLKEEFPPAEIEWRVGSTNGEKTSGLALAYITSRHVMDRLDEVCGPENWQSSYVETPKGRVLCTISIKIDGDWVSKSDGAGDSDVEADKGAISDSLKRAAVHWGIGRYLYDLGNIWVDIEGQGKSYRIKRDQYSKLVAFLSKSAPNPEQPKPEIRRLSKEESKPIFDDVNEKLLNAKTVEALTKVGSDEASRLATIDMEFENDLRAVFREHRAALVSKAKSDKQPPTGFKSVAPSFDHLQPNDVRE